MIRMFWIILNWFTKRLCMGPTRKLKLASLTGWRTLKEDWGKIFVSISIDYVNIKGVFCKKFIEYACFISEVIPKSEWSTCFMPVITLIWDTSRWVGLLRTVKWTTWLLQTQCSMFFLLNKVIDRIVHCNIII